ncbi:GNAT family N-acetyltransferase [Candidatus Microgenomates bacterium]|nr:GNAT family N-acetyltransferase [Candidatus Microgenomates bacterium]
MEIIRDMDGAISVMHEVSAWMEKNGMNPSVWWQPGNMNADFLLQHIEPNEFYVSLVDGKPVASVVLQDSERNQSWKSIDGDNPQKALYIHWLCVARDFASQGFSGKMVEFAAEEAGRRGLKLLRLDTNADEEKLCKLYESLGFKLMGTEKEGNFTASFYQKEI